ncbi:hypothetical protein FJC63_26620, partial [Escherichia coli]|nr:hypothetical protein [Escherichia coli]
MVKSLKTPCNRFCGLLFRFWQIIWRDKRPSVLRCVRVTQPVMMINQRLPGIYPRPVRTVVVRLEALTA